MPDNLALRMRPRTISEVIGQKHLVGEGKIIRRMVEANMLSSMILYGPPGIGKTSIASAIAGTTKFAFRCCIIALPSCYITTLSYYLFTMKKLLLLGMTALFCFEIGRASCRERV